MALFTADFSGASGQWLVSRPGWAYGGGYYECLQTDGAGSLGIAARSNDGRGIVHDQGTSSHYIEVVVGTGFLQGHREAEYGVAVVDKQEYLSFSYIQNESRLVLSVSGKSAVGSYNGPLNAGDTIKLCFLYPSCAYEWYVNGVLVTAGDIAVYGLSEGTKVGIFPSYGSTAARSDVIRSFKSDAYSGPPDTTPPTLTSATGMTTGDTTASGTVTTNEANGILYYLASGSATETQAAVEAGLSKAVTALGLQSISLTGLNSGTTYRIHYMHVDAAGNKSTVLSSNTFTTTAPDVTAPTLTSPTATSTGSTTATGSVSTNEANGTLYYLASANATETVATVKALGATQAVSVTGVQGVSVTGLTASTSYYLHFVHRDAAGNDSARVTSAQFTTAAAGSTPKLTLPPLRNNAGTLLASQTGATAHVYEVATGNKVATVTGCTSDVAGVMQVPHASLVPGTEYRAVIVLASGAEGLQKATATP